MTPILKSLHVRDSSAVIYVYHSFINPLDVIAIPKSTQLLRKSHMQFRVKLYDISNNRTTGRKCKFTANSSGNNVIDCLSSCININVIVIVLIMYAQIYKQPIYVVNEKRSLTHKIDR